MRNEEARAGVSSDCSRLIFAASETCADMLYASGMLAPDPFLWYGRGGQCGVVVNTLEAGRARKQVKAGTLVLSQDEAAHEWGLSSSDVSPEALIRGVSSFLGVTEWVVPTTFPLGLAKAVEAHGVRLDPVPAFFPERQRKDGTEVVHIREGIALAELGLQRALDILGQSIVGQDDVLLWCGETLTSEVLRGEIDALISRHGGSASHTIAAPGPQAADPHVAGSGPIRSGLPVVIDIFPRVDATGYYGDLTRTVVKGRASATVRRAFDAVRRAQEKAIAAARAGVPASSVDRAAAHVLAEAGFSTRLRASPPEGFIHGLGHGLGLEIHEPPRLMERSDEPLSEGNVVTIEPGLYYPEWGGVRLEDVVVIRANGVDSLTTAGKQLEIA